jgi:predicted transposase YbfD/YdcC
MDRGLCLSEAVVEEKTNEIPAVRDLLEITEVQGSVVAWDALNTQKETVTMVVRKKGDYMGALKGNQHDFYQDVKEDEATLRSLKEGGKKLFQNGGQGTKRGSRPGVLSDG